MVRSFALQQSFLLLATVSAEVFQTGLELKIEMAHAVDVPQPNGVQQKSASPFAHPAVGGRELPITQLSSWERRMRDAGLAMVGSQRFVMLPSLTPVSHLMKIRGRGDSDHRYTCRRRKRERAIRVGCGCTRPDEDSKSKEPHHSSASPDHYANSVCGF